MSDALMETVVPTLRKWGLSAPRPLRCWATVDDPVAPNKHFLPSASALVAAVLRAERVMGRRVKIGYAARVSRCRRHWQIECIADD